MCFVIMDMIGDSIMRKLNTNKQHNNRINLKKKRIDELLDSCSEEVTKQIIGLFGLTPDMFKDRDGGNVTTNHNFEKGIVATEEDKLRYKQYMKNINNPIDRTNYDKELPKMRRKLFQQKDDIIDAYTGKKLSRDGRTHLDHVVPVKQFETDPRKILNMSINERIALANENIVPCNSSINMSMQDSDKSEWAKRRNKKNKGKTNAEYYEVDVEKLTKTKIKASINIEYNLMKKTVIKQGREVISTGIDEAKKML